MQQILYQNAVDIILYYPDNLGAVRTSAVKDFFYGKPNAQGFYPQQNVFINWQSAAPLSSGGGSSSSRGAVDRDRDRGGGGCWPWRRCCSGAGPRPGERE